MAPVYATLSDYRSEISGSTAADATVDDALIGASRRLDELLIGAVYDVDEDGAPTDPTVADVFMRACCAQARYLIDLDDPTGVKGQYSSVSVGSVSYTRGQGKGGSTTPPRYADDAIGILQVEGVLPVNVITYY